MIQQMLFWDFSPRKTAGPTSCDSRCGIGVASHRPGIVVASPFEHSYQRLGFFIG
jgi:hypothetical protein